MQELGLPASALPCHIAIIMDGNGRWARQRGLQRIEGHRAGVRAVRESITQCGRLGIGYLTLYSFSSENWKRPQAEVVALMTLCAAALVNERDEIMRSNVRLRQIGSREGLPADVNHELDETMRMSAGNAGLTVTLALNYGSRAEIVEGVRKLAHDVADGKLRPEEIDEQHVSDSLYTAGLPDPDLVIRTAGEMRLSNFLLWQVSYAEFCAVPVLWPDFRTAHLNDAIRQFARRERRYGDVLPPGTPAT
ncbi:MAG: isoprenyl transferase [Phycisphaerae bacterium]|nr:isoprenyl transferase [Phycisphaerae bacterium]